MDERPVAGSCEQCGRTYSLFIPVPGSGNLKLDRVAEAFAWCIECGQFVGRACCWVRGLRCSRCAEAHREADANDAAGGFAALAATRAAIRQLDGIAAEFSGIEETLAAVDSVDVSSAVGAWEDAWLAAGALEIRLDGSRDAAVGMIRDLPPNESERTVKLEAELDSVTVSHVARWRSVTDAIAQAGRRLAISEDSRAASGAASAPAAPRLTPNYALLPAGATAARTPLSSVEAPRAPTKAPVVATAALPSAPRAPSITPPVAATRPLASPTPAPSMLETHVDPAPERVLVAEAEPPAAGSGARRRGTGIAVLMIVGVAVFGGWLAGVIGPLAGDSAIVANRGRDLPDSVRGSFSATATPRAASSTPASVPQSTAAGEVAIPILVTVDLHRVGPLDAGDLPITRIIGTPEVVPFPTSFDRSLRLTGATAGVCIALPPSPTEGASSMAFDFHLGDAGLDGRLVVTIGPSGDAEAIGLALDLDRLRTLAPDAWYRVVVTGEDDAGRVQITVLGDDRPVFDAGLDKDSTNVSTSSDEACIQSELSSPEAFIYVDSLRVER